MLPFEISQRPSDRGAMIGAAVTSPGQAPQGGDRVNDPVAAASPPASAEPSDPVAPLPAPRRGLFVLWRRLHGDEAQRHWRAVGVELVLNGRDNQLRRLRPLY